MPNESATNFLRPDAVALPTGALAALVVLAFAAWVVAHRLTRWRMGAGPVTGHRIARFAAFAARVALGTLALWLAFQFAGRWILFETNWSLVTAGFVGALALEIVIALYAWERRLLPVRVGRGLLALRLALITVVLLILSQPVLAWLQNRHIERRVVVLVDDSQSMQLADSQMTSSEKLDLAIWRGAHPAGRRPSLASAPAAARDLVSAVAAERVHWNGPDAGAGPMTKPDAARQSALLSLAERALAFATNTRAAIDSAASDAGARDDDVRRLVSDTRNRLGSAFTDEWREAGEAVQSNPGAVRQHLDRSVLSLQSVAEALPELAAVADTGYLDKLSESEKTEIDQAALTARSAIARDVLTRPDGDGKSLLDRLRSQYDVTVARFGKSAAEVDEAGLFGSGEDAEFRGRTDVTGALEHMMQKVPGESLAGVMLLSDGRHNGAKPVDDVARALGVQGSPVRAVAIGSARGPKDAAFLKVESPESVYLGDRLKVRADVKADGMKGGRVKISLRREGAVVDSQTIPVPEASYRTSVRLSHSPEEKGIFEYAVTIDPIDGELFDDNNEWKFETAVTDDRTNVLIVEGRPRWEFRYLRNLFYGRDKSVHLQYVLLEPDSIEGQRSLPAVAASATRAFGDAEATRLPAARAEWLRFDVIIIGDVAPAAMTAETWKTVETCVEERGALLIGIAGPRSMPHAFTSATARKLLPVEYQAVASPEGISPPESSYALRVTTEGRNSPIMEQSASAIESGEVWSQLPPLMWRHPITTVKPGAEVLAYAEAAGRRPPSQAATAEERLEAFARQKQFESANALIVTSRYGLGKVAMLNFDQTWRLRYGTGDIHHHRFWGNLLRWGTGENLRAGVGNVRLGTDRLTYETGQPVGILARLTTDGFTPQTGAEMTAVVYDPGGNAVARRRLEYREGSNGMYAAEIPPDALTAVGRYRVELTGNDVDRALRGSPGAKVETHFTQLATINPVELGDLALDREFLGKAAAHSGGSVVEPAGSAALADAFGAASRTIAERRETTLWDNWILLVSAVILLTAEWLIRRRVGVA